MSSVRWFVTAIIKPTGSADAKHQYKHRPHVAGPRPIRCGTSGAFGSLGFSGGSSSTLRGDRQAQNAVSNNNTPSAVTASFHDIHWAYNGEFGSISSV